MNLTIKQKMILNSLKLILILAIVKPFAAIPHAHVKLPRLADPLKPSEDYTHSLVVDNDEPEQYHLYWKLVDNDEYLQFEVHCKTTGWAGFGLSPNGDMTGADIAIGWVDDITGKAHLRV